MNITICENLKQYRKDKGNTQEELANHLGISIQAVSKWERNEGFPDITLLPQIAMYYNVSVDDLLGVGKIQIAQKLAEYHKRSDEFHKNGDSEGKLSLWTEAMNEFPNNKDVLYSYMYALPIERSDEIIKIAECLYNDLDDPGNKYEAIWELFHLYMRLGIDEKAIEYARQLPRAEVSRDHMLTKVYKGSKLVDCVQENLPELVQLIDDQIYRIVWHGDLTRDEQRKARQYCLKIYNWLYEDGDYGYYHTRVSNIYADFAIFDALDENIDGVMTNLSKMADCEINFLTQECVKRTSFLANRTYQGHTGYSNSTENACRWAINFMYRHWFEFCREDERFKEIEKRLEKYAN